MAQTRSIGITWAGLAAGPFAWALSTQGHYAGVPWACGNPVRFMPLTAAVLVLVALSGSFLSWRAWRNRRADPVIQSSPSGAPHGFIAGVGALGGILFAAVIAMQGIAALILTGCER